MILLLISYILSTKDKEIHFQSRISVPLSVLVIPLCDIVPYIPTKRLTSNLAKSRSSKIVVKLPNSCEILHCHGQTRSRDLSIEYEIEGAWYPRMQNKNYVMCYEYDFLRDLLCTPSNSCTETCCWQTKITMDNILENPYSVTQIE